MIALAILLAVPAAQLPSWNFRWDPRACCCGKTGPCPCPDHQLPHDESDPSMRACGTGGNYVTTAHAPTLAMPVVAETLIARVERAELAPTHTLPHASPDVERPHGPS